MEMTLRWFGTGYDSVTLEQIRQIPGVTGVITTLYNTKPGEVWSRDDIHKLKAEVEAAGLKIAGIESVNVCDAIKVGTPDRDMYIDNYIQTLEHLGEEDIHLVVYNFMPVFDWTRTELARVRPDGSTVLAYNQDIIDKLDPSKMFDSINDNSNGFVMPGWEPDRLAKLQELFEMYKDVTEEKLVEYSEKNNEDNPYEDVLICRNSEQVKQDKMTTFYEEVLNAYMNNPIYINQKVLMKTSNLANLVKELCDADEVNIELGCDISCCGKPTQYNTVENIVVVKNKERTDFKVSHNEWYRKLKDYRISLNFTID